MTPYRENAYVVPPPRPMTKAEQLLAISQAKPGVRPTLWLRWVAWLTYRNVLRAARAVAANGGTIVGYRVMCASLAPMEDALAAELVAQRLRREGFAVERQAEKLSISWAVPK